MNFAICNIVTDHMARPLLKDDETYLVPTVKVLVHSGRHSDYVRGVLTSFSKYNLITEKLRRECNLPLSRVSVPQISTPHGAVLDIVGQSRLTISPHFNEERTEIIDVLVAKRFSTKLCGDKIHPLARATLSRVQLADPDFDAPGDIDLVLGAQQIPYLMRGGCRTVYGPLCFAKETIFGWIVMGRVPMEDKRHGQLPSNMVFM